jgi:HlyD family secretion protein
VLTAQIEAVRAQGASVAMDVASTDARVAQIRERISKSSVVNPLAGTVLSTYARAGEVVQPGQPLYKIADLDTLDFRAYVTGSQLGSIRLGEEVQVRVESGSDQLRTIAGRVRWISPTAEFTPTPVQTRDERADLVYAVKIRVPNADGALKIGMPGDITLGAAVARDAGAK